MTLPCQQENAYSRQGKLWFPDEVRVTALVDAAAASGQPHG